MKILDEFASNEEIKSFLIYHLDDANDEKSKINPSLTKRQVWDINMGAVIKTDLIKTRSIVTRNITREFGRYYEE